MKPYDSETGSVWVYNLQRAQEDDFQAASDEEVVFIVLDGEVIRDDETMYRGRKYRRAMSLITGQSENFTEDSRLNMYSDPLL